MRIIAVLLILFGLSISVACGEETGTHSDLAPFGLKWGMSVADAKASGVKLSNLDDEESFGISYRATDLPKMLPDAEFISLSFGFQDKLWRIAAIGRNVSNDPYGNRVKARYNELVAALAGKYGRGTSHEYQDTELWKKANEFLMGIKVGRSWFYTDFDASNAFVQLGIQAEDVDTAHWIIIYEFKSLRAIFEMDQKAHEKDAL